MKEYKYTKYFIYNVYLFNYFFQLDQCNQLCTNIENKYPDLIEDIILIKSIMSWRQNKKTEAIETLKKFVHQKEQPSAKLKCTLVAVKLLLIQV